MINKIKSIIEKIKNTKIYKFIERIVNWGMNLVFPEPTPVPEGEPYCTGKGMAKKALYYGIMIVAGLLGYLVLHYLLVYVLDLPTVTIDLESRKEYATFFENGTYSLTAIEWMIFFITFLSVSLTPILRYLPWGAVYFFDGLYCVSVGYNTAFMYLEVAKEDMRTAVLTLIISGVLCTIPYLFFRIKKVKLPKAFTNTVYALYWIIVMGAAILRVLCFIPVLGDVASFFLNLYNLPGAGEFLLFGRVIIYFLFMFLWLERMLDFVTIKAPKKYEWTMTFHLVYSATIMINYCFIFIAANTDEVVKVLKGLLGGGIVK